MRYWLLFATLAACDASPAARRLDGWSSLRELGVPPADRGASLEAATVSCSFLAPAGGKAKNPVSFRVTMPAAVVGVSYLVDGKYAIGESTDDAGGFPVTYSFSELGTRVVSARGRDAAGAHLATCDLSLTVEASLPEVPYFYQYANNLYPASTCQNTSIAMVLAWLGWKGKPDDITSAWGKDKAQSPAGLAAVFNDYAAKLGVPQRLQAHTDGSVGAVRALLAVGKPVIVHGYFTGGHVLVILGFTGSQYVVHDPAGKWSQQFKGGYPAPQGPTSGEAVAYAQAPFEQAIATSDGSAPEPIWYHELK